MGRFEEKASEMRAELRSKYEREEISDEDFMDGMADIDIAHAEAVESGDSSFFEDEGLDNFYEAEGGDGEDDDDAGERG